ncbi:MAG: hypothetical protein RLZZ382_705 [Bacteroidota bacterium]
MKALLSVLFLSFLVEISSQITISVADFANSGDTVRISQADGTGLDFTSTGANYTWDFSSLAATSQYLKEYNPIGFASLLVFGTYGPVAPTNYRASYFNPTNDLPLDQLSQFLPVSLSDLNQYTKRMTDSITSLGYSISVNGQGVPFKSDTIETRYKLPLHYNDSHYSRGYTYIDLNPVIDFKIKQYRQRTTNVDGWGTIITPKGTFQALRLRHDIAEIDSVYQTFFGAGQWFGTPPIQRIEYEWFANGEKEWVLKATETNGTVNQVEYQENYLGLDASLIESTLDVSIGPNPVHETLFIDSKSPVYLAQIFDDAGRLVLSTSLNNALNSSLDLNLLHTGTYRIILSGVHGYKQFPLVKF